MMSKSALGVAIPLLLSSGSNAEQNPPPPISPYRRPYTSSVVVLDNLQYADTISLVARLSQP